MIYQHKCEGTCSRKITFEINNEIISNVVFEGGCNGNAKGIAALSEGMNAKDVANRLSGIQCGFKKTSCPDQLSVAIRKALENN